MRRHPDHGRRQDTAHGKEIRPDAESTASAGRSARRSPRSRGSSRAWPCRSCAGKRTRREIRGPAVWSGFREEVACRSLRQVSSTNGWRVRNMGRKSAGYSAGTNLIALARKNDRCHLVAPAGVQHNAPEVELPVANLSHDDAHLHALFLEMLLEAPPLDYLPFLRGEHARSADGESSLLVRAARCRGLQDMNAKREHGEPFYLLLPATLTLRRNAEMPETLRTEADVCLEEWAVDQGALGIYFVRSLFLDLIVPVVHGGDDALRVRQYELPPAHFMRAIICSKERKKCRRRQGVPMALARFGRLVLLGHKRTV